MRLPLLPTCGLVLLLALSGMARADVTISQSNQPAATIEGSLTALLGRERQALGAVTPERLGVVARLPVKKVRAGAKAEPAVLQYDPQWLASQPAAKGNSDWACLTQALYSKPGAKRCRVSSRSPK